MFVLMLMAVALVASFCIPAYTLAVYALPFMIAVEAARWAYASGSGLIGAGVVGLVAGAAAYGLLIVLFMVVRAPIRTHTMRAAGQKPSRERRWRYDGGA